MLRRTLCVFVTFRPVHAVHTGESKPEALNAVQRLYESRWLGANSEFLKFAQPQHHYVPFFLSAGTVRGTYTATIEWSTTYTDSNGKRQTRKSYSHVQPTAFGSSFCENTSQTYAGFRRDTKHVKVLEGDYIPLMMKPSNEVDMSVADDVNVFELSDKALSRAVKEAQHSAAVSEVQSMLRRQFLGCDNVQVKFSEFKLNMRTATPVYVPAFVVPVSYDDHEYKIVVNGVNGQCKGPYLYNPETVARLSFLGSFTAFAGGFHLASTFATAAPLLAASSVGATGMYYTMFHASRWWPKFKIERRRAAQEAEKARVHAQKTSSSSSSSESSSSSDQDTSSSSDSGSSWGWGRRSAGESKRSSGSSGSKSNDERTTRTTSDHKGYYKTLSLNGNESVNEIRAAFRKKALKAHPDAGGSDEAMKKVNEAYQVLRDPKKRMKYDAGSL